MTAAAGSSPAARRGKTENSSGRWVFIATSITITDTAILKVKNTSSRNTGKGNTIIDRMMRMRIGAASARRLEGLRS
ncbi:hypothetical protein AGMMS50225_07060 [Betaproteobacteria bacterium]|nr:hypothetical protein AGMMS50225_07060 [Betaproteobacteria bacterium]